MTGSLAGKEFVVIRQGMIRWGWGVAVAIIGVALPGAARGDGYYYAPKSFYVAPPLVGDGYPIFSPAPIVVYERPQIAPGPVVGFYQPLAVRPGRVRVRESLNVNGPRARYRYQE
ncbi:MAG: hypothetical protein ACKV0T_28850 [Planctomycetales bacterium]